MPLEGLAVGKSLDQGEHERIRRPAMQGVEEKASGPNASGYTMIQADSLDAAAELARGCPLLEHGREINVFETFAM